MTNKPERSIKEIAEELCEQLTEVNIRWYEDNESWNISNNIDAADLICKTLQTERQRCEEVVEVERERISRSILSIIPLCENPDDAIYQIQQLFTNAK